MLDNTTFAIVSAVLYTLVPLGVAIGAWFVARSRVQRPGLFLVIAMFFMIGLNSIVGQSLRKLQLLASMASPQIVFGSDQAGFLMRELGLAVTAALLTGLAGGWLLRAAMRVQLKR